MTARRAWIAGAVALCASQAAHAEQPRETPAAIEVDRDAAPAGSVGFGFDGGEPVPAWGASIAAGWIERPIALPAGAFGPGSPASRPVRRRQTLVLGGALAVGDSVVLDGAIRASHQTGDRLTAAGDPARLARAVFHDVRLGVRIRAAGDDERAAFLRADLTLPAGDDDQLAGDARWTLAWRLIGRLRLPHAIVVAASAGVRLHGAEVAVGDRLVGDELFAAAGVAVPVGERVALTGELAGALGDQVGALSGPRPLEARAGVVVRALPELTIGARVGVGLNDADDKIGAPGLRGLVELAWTPRGQPAEQGSATTPATDEPEPDEP